MAEYIKRETVLEHAEYDNNYRLIIPAEAIKATPTADIAPVVHGRWVSVPHKLARVCSVCNRDEPYKFADIDADVYNYCPNCGARMDEVE